MSYSKLQQIKSSTLYSRCGQVGNWIRQCPNKSGSSFKHTLMSVVNKHGRGETAVAKTLWAVAEDEEEFGAYICCKENCKRDKLVDTNSFPKLLSNNDGFLDDEPCAEVLHNTFEELPGNNFEPDDNSDSTFFNTNCDDGLAQEYQQKCDQKIQLIEDNENCLLLSTVTTCKTHFEDQDKLYLEAKIPASIYQMEHMRKKRNIAIFHAMFYGALLNTGDQKSIIGEQQAENNCRKNEYLI